MANGEDKFVQYLLLYRTQTKLILYGREQDLKQRQFFHDDLCHMFGMIW